MPDWWPMGMFNRVLRIKCGRTQQVLIYKYSRVYDHAHNQLVCMHKHCGATTTTCAIVCH